MKQFIAALVLVLVVGGVLTALVASVGWATTLAILLGLVVTLGIVFVVAWAILVLTDGW